MSGQVKTLWRAPSGRIHLVRACSGGPGPTRMKPVKMTQALYEADPSPKCRCTSIIKWAKP